MSLLPPAKQGTSIVVAVTVAAASLVTVGLLIMPMAWIHLRLGPRIDAVGIPGPGTSAPSKCSSQKARLVRVLQVLVTATSSSSSVPVTVSIADTASARELVTAIVCGSVDSVIVGVHLLGLTGETGKNDDGTLWLSVTEGDSSSFPPLSVSPSLDSAISALSGSGNGTPVHLTLIAWRMKAFRV